MHVKPLTGYHSVNPLCGTERSDDDSMIQFASVEAKAYGKTPAIKASTCFLGFDTNTTSITSTTTSRK